MGLVEIAHIVQRYEGYNQYPGMTPHIDARLMMMMMMMTNRTRKHRVRGYTEFNTDHVVYTLFT